MIMESRLGGSIDQIHGIINFEHNSESLNQWDERVSIACASVNDILESLSTKRKKNYEIHDKIRKSQSSGYSGTPTKVNQINFLRTFVSNCSKRLFS